MKGQRGGAVYGFLAAIGFLVVVMAIAFAVCTGSAGASPLHDHSATATTAARATSAVPMRYRDDRRECGRDGGRCDDGHYQDDHQGGCNNFCPKFDKSPVDHSFNFTVCLPGSTCTSDGDKKDQPGPKDGQEVER